MKKIIIAALATAALMGAAQATTILNWGGDYVSANAQMVLGTPTDTGLKRTWAYSDTTAKSPSSGYSGPTFYGALESESSAGPTDLTVKRVTQNAAGDRIDVNNDQSTATYNRAAGLIFFKQADWLALTSGAVSFDATSSIDIRFTANNRNSGGSRAAVLNNGTWYLSSTEFTAYSGTLSIPNAAAENWGAWTATGAPLAAPPGSFTTPGSTFTQIQAVGYWFDVTRSGSTPRNANVAVDQIIFNAIPEPGSVGLLALGAAAFMIRRRRMRG